MALEARFARRTCLGSRAGRPQRCAAACRPRAASGVSSNAASPAPAPLEAPRTSFHRGITYIGYEANTAGVKFNTSGVRVLIDPWFVGDLTFGGAGWLYAGRKRAIGRTTRVDLQAVLAETDVLAITQGLDDHCHIPTLTAVADKSIPVVAHPDAVARLRPLGFTNVTPLAPGQSVTVGPRGGADSNGGGSGGAPSSTGRLRIVGTEGALVGPPWSSRQLGLLMREELRPGERPASLYFESHCDFISASLEAGLRALHGGPGAASASSSGSSGSGRSGNGSSGSSGGRASGGDGGGVDVVVSPVVTTLLGVGPASYELVQGDVNLQRLLSLTRPKVLLPLMNHDIEQLGPLAGIVCTRGSETGVAAVVAAAGLDTRVEYPAPPGEALAIAL